jgi:hypothetical protein
MQNSTQSPTTETASEVQSLIGQVFAGVVSAKQDESIIIAIADPNGEPFPVPCILPKAGMIGFTPTIKDQRYTLLESGHKLFVRITAIDLDIAPPVVRLVEVPAPR